MTQVKWTCREDDGATNVIPAREHVVPSPWTRRRMMFIAMNRFRVKKGSEEAFEKVWLSRDTQLTKVPGFG